MPVSPLSKREFVDEVADRIGEDLREHNGNYIHDAWMTDLVKELLVAVEDVVACEVEEGRVVTVPGVARFRPGVVPARPRRKGRNPWGDDPNEEIWLPAKPAKTTLRATPARGIKDALPSAGSATGKALAKEKAKKARRNGR